MTRKVLEVNEGAHHYVCVKREGDINPYRVYKVWYDMGLHRKLIEKYADMTSVMILLTSMIRPM